MFRSVHELTDAIRRFIDAIRRFIDAYDERARPVTWAKAADQILAHARPACCPVCSLRRSRRSAG